jgi:hypothetical protein
MREGALTMPKVVITHNVADVDKWLSFKSERAEAIGQIGGTNVEEYALNDGGNVIAITCDMDDVDAALGVLASPPAEMAAAMEAHGVIPPLTVYVAR